jgi:hypothetical protein
LHLSNNTPVIPFPNALLTPCDILPSETWHWARDTPSTLLFVAVFDILLTLLDTANIGTPHAYADDLANIAPTLLAQQLQADLVSAFYLLTGLEIASAKVEAITLNNGQHLHNNEI